MPITWPCQHVYLGFPLKQRACLSSSGKWQAINKWLLSPGWFGSVDRPSACRLKGPRFDSSQGHVPWLRAHPQWRRGVQEEAAQYFSPIDVSNSLSFSLPLYKKSIKYIFFKRLFSINKHGCIFTAWGPQE